MWKSTMHHYDLIDQGTDGTVSNSTAELAPQNALSLNRTSWFKETSCQSIEEKRREEELRTLSRAGPMLDSTAKTQ